MTVRLHESGKREIRRRGEEKARAWRLQLLTMALANVLGLTHRTVMDALTDPKMRPELHKALDSAIDTLQRMQASI
jgi:hypothetical protein